MSLHVDFEKMNGCGNDFVMLDNRDGRHTDNLVDLAQKMCPRRFSVGADGLIVIEPSAAAAFKMRILNADGSEAEMCGNGARCAVAFAKDIGAVPGAQFEFETLAGVLDGQILEDDQVRVRMSAPFDLQKGIELEVLGQQMTVHSLNTGVPHAIVFEQDLENVDVQALGSAIRYHDRFAPAGTNVNFVQVLTDQKIAIRTYERGVEGETFACGTGATASAILSSLIKGLKAPVEVQTTGGLLKIDFAASGLEDVYMQGAAQSVYKGQFLS